MATRKTFDEGESIADAISHKPIRRYQCGANQCPMPGTMSGEGGNGVCAYHYGTHSTDWPRITQVLLDWANVTDEVNRHRTLACNPATATDTKLMDGEFKTGVERVLQWAGSNWEADLKPQLTRGKRMDTYSTWAYRLECFVGQRVVDCLRTRIGKKAA